METFSLGTTDAIYYFVCILKTRHNYLFIVNFSKAHVLLVKNHLFRY